MTGKKRRPGFHHRTAVSTLFRSICLKEMKAPAASFTRTSEAILDSRCVANGLPSSKQQDLTASEYDFASGLLRGKCPRRRVPVVGAPRRQGFRRDWVGA